MIEQQEVPKYNYTIGMINVPPLDVNQQSFPIFLTLPSTTTSTTMGPPINALSKTSTIVASVPMKPEKLLLTFHQSHKEMWPIVK